MIRSLVRKAPLVIVGAAIAASVACSDETITLATVSANDAATPTRCTQPSDCPSGTFCERSACGDAAGTCELYPTDCTNVEKPVCGCDGILYFNDCLRRASGATASTPGMCKLENAVTCAGKQGLACPTGTVCGRLVGMGPCANDAIGTCWVVPDQCPAPGQARFDLCGGGAECRGLCDAVKGGGVYHKAGFCP
jgi:hypothetical protein